MLGLIIAPPRTQLHPHKFIIPGKWCSAPLPDPSSGRAERLPHHTWDPTGT